jgi:hypothetical protein
MKMMLNYQNLMTSIFNFSKTENDLMVLCIALAHLLSACILVSDSSGIIQKKSQEASVV